MKNYKDNLKKGEKKVKGFFGEFKTFIQRGNVIDLAVGVVIGGAFGKIVTSLVNDILMPIIGLLIGGQDFKGLSIKVKDTTIAYGSFIQNVVDFLIVAFFIFVFVKIINNLFKKEEPKKEEVKADAAELVQQKLSSQMDDILESYNTNLMNVQTIYSSIAKAMSGN